MDSSATRLDFGFVNAFLLKSARGFVLVDTGTPGHRKRLAAALGEAGCKRGNLDLVVVTHADFDHSGNCAWLRETFGAKVAVHEADAPMLETGIAPKRTMNMRFGKLLTFLAALRPGANPTCPADIRLVDGQSLEEWGLEGRVLHLPGHTPGALGLLVEDGRGGLDFYAGDVFANWRKPAASPFVHDLEAYRASLVRAKRLIPRGATVHPGHGPAFPASALDSITL